MLSSRWIAKGFWLRRVTPIAAESGARLARYTVCRSQSKIASIQTTCGQLPARPRCANSIQKRCSNRSRASDAGAIVLGKTNLHELSLGWTTNNQAFGAVHNPYDRTRIPGGSSGGTAAAVAARMAPLGVAEDT